MFLGAAAAAPPSSDGNDAGATEGEGAGVDVELRSGIRYFVVSHGLFSSDMCVAYAITFSIRQAWFPFETPGLP